MKNEPRTMTVSETVPISGVYDVVVCGGGPAGIAASIAAKENIPPHRVDGRRVREEIGMDKVFNIHLRGEALRRDKKGNEGREDGGMGKNKLVFDNIRPGNSTFHYTKKASS